MTKALVKEVTARKVLDDYVYGGAHVAEVPVKNLKVDMSYQREFGETLVSRIVSSFDVNKFELPTVNRRPDKSLFVVDGGHRLEAALRIGMRTITCRIIEIPAADEAICFIDLNRQRRWVSPVQHFKAELAAGNPAAIEINCAVTDRGLRVSTSHSPNVLSCTSTLHRLYARGGTVGMCRVLDASLQAWPHNEARRLAGQLLQGIGVFYDKRPKADDEKLVAALANVTCSYLLGKSSGRWHAWKSLDRLGGSLIDATCEEIEILYGKQRRVSF